MKLLFPTQHVKIERREGQDYIWGIVRKKWYVLQPEELVRQAMLDWMVREKGVSAALISVEKGIKYLKLQKRFDVVVYDNEGKAFILCECKAPDVPLSQDTLNQIARYNVSIQAPHLLLTNGRELLFFSLLDGKYVHKKEGWWK